MQRSGVLVAIMTVATLVTACGMNPSCDVRESAVLDYGADQVNAETAREALDQFLDGRPGFAGLVVRDESVGADHARWALAASSSAPTSAVVRAERTPRGWAVTHYERCSG